MDLDPGVAIRAAAFAYIDEIRRRSGGFVTWQDLQAFTFEGRRIPLITQRGIRTVSGIPGALSIFTTYAPNPESRPYDDELGADDFPRYKWRGDDPNHYDNTALRYSMEAGDELIGSLACPEASTRPAIRFGSWPRSQTSSSSSWPWTGT